MQIINQQMTCFRIAPDIGEAARHILKQTGSYELANYAMQDTPDVVQQRYGRFLPQDKAALAAKILNRV